MVDLSGLEKFSSMLDGAPEADAAGIRELPLSLIDPDPDQPRKHFDQAKLAELAESIQSQGLIQPITVRAMGGRYQIIAGERRWRAAQLAKLVSIQAIIRDDLEARAQMVENLQREDLSPFEIYRVVAAELDSGVTQKELSKAYGKSKQWISDYAAVAKMPPALQDALRDGLVNDISALNILARLHKQAPDKVEKLASSGAPISRHLVNQLADSLARAAAGSQDVGQSPTPPSSQSPTTPASAPRPSGVADDGQGMDIGGGGPAGVPGSNTGNAADDGDNYRPPAPPADAQKLAVNITVRYEGDTYLVLYSKQLTDDAGVALVLLQGASGLTLYAPLRELLIVSIT